MKRNILTFLAVFGLLLTTACGAAPGAGLGNRGGGGGANVNGGGSGTTVLPPSGGRIQPQTGAQGGASPGMVIPTNPNDPANAYGAPPDPHWVRLESLHPHRGSMEEWLKAAGFTWDTIRHDARQPLQEDSAPPRSTRYISGYIVDGRNIVVNWPNIVTTDQPSRITKRDNTVEYMPDPKDPSVLYTNVVANGPVTVYASGYSWGQFTSIFGVPGTVGGNLAQAQVGSTAAQGGASAASADTCLTLAQLEALGSVRSYRDTNGNATDRNSGQVAGVQIAPKANWDIPDGWEFHVNSNRAATQIPANQVGTAWSPAHCRPLKA